MKENLALLVPLYGTYKYGNDFLKAIHFGINTPEQKKSYIMAELSEKQIDFFQIVQRKNSKLKTYERINTQRTKVY